MLGLVLIFAGGAVFAFLSSQMQWPIAAARFAALAVGSVLGVNLVAVGLLVTAAGCGKTHASSPAPRRRAALLLRLTLANLLAPAFLYSAMTSDPVAEAALKEAGWDAWFGAAIAALMALAWRLWRRSRQYGALGADEAMARDPRPPVLYLRSFADDGEAQATAQTWRERARNLVATPVTPEQEMADLLDAVGPVVAIGKPGETLPELGAARLYVSDDRWQAKVQELMGKARLVVIRLGASPGLLWEIERSLADLPRQRLVLALLGGSVIAPALVQRLAPVLGPTFAEALPQELPRSLTRWLYAEQPRRIGGVVYFGSDGCAHAVPVEMKWLDVFMILSTRPSFRPLRRAWRQVFERLGIGGGQVSRSRAIAVALAMFFGWAGAHWFYLGRRRRGVVYLLTIPLLLAPLFLGFIDAFRFLWVDRATFDARFSALPSSPRARTMASPGEPT